MTEFSFFLICSIVILSLYCVGFALTIWRTKIHNKRLTKSFELTTQAIEIRNRVIENKSTIEKHPLINGYLQGIETIFNEHLSGFKGIKIAKVKLLDRQRLSILEEYRKSPKYIRALCFDYSELLRSIYQTNHPIRYRISECRSAISRFFFLLFIKLIQLVLFRLIKSNKIKTSDDSRRTRSEISAIMKMQPNDSDICDITAVA